MSKTFSFLIITFLLGSCVTQPQESTSAEVTITAADIGKVGTSIPVDEIGEAVGSVKLYPPRWVEADENTPAHAVVEGSILPVDPNGWPINFRVLLPEKWSKRAMQQGGGGNNGVITVEEANNRMFNVIKSTMLRKGFAMYGSDSGHQTVRNRPGAPPAPAPLATGPTTGDEWSLNDEAIRNLGYMQMKKTHDAAMVILQRLYGAEPAYNYYVGNSQGGREALTVAQRYPEDYEGIISNVPIVNFSTLMLSPVLIRIQEKPEANWIPTAKVKAITAEFLRQTDELDGLADGIISNYVDAREIFNVHDGVGPDDPWAALRAPNNTDPNPSDTTDAAKLTDGQIETLEFVYSSYRFPQPLANGVTSFGMWTPTTEPDGFGLITDARYRGQEGAGTEAPMFTHLGILGVKGFLMQDLSANPLDYREGPWEERRQQLSGWLDSTDPDLSKFHERGGKIIFTIGAIDNIASSGAQMDYYQSLLDEMGREKIDRFARLYVIPNGNHILFGRSYSENGKGEPVPVRSIPAADHLQKIDLLIDWVEREQAPAKTLVIDEEGNIGTDKEVRGYLLCSYPNYQQYTGGPVEIAASYESTAPEE
ncbi:tannase/feruloyl esterase family alpha/beta hydrolase [Flavilitoribacter nigricans]|uniref:Tannase/feruloyl esterase family alpha/beta hydrolase n=1 Tax=Flavilitoribacter nigricans (strain ATCC 23147 / DSM 23189 / NBRC 102662 / NCIMB 1420 / SS-2) TaxID=1122177 RepID=A0A2D0NE98_FLAN2|nr:tannase/feruloyl esterase family alpha/beta hydrolase [Flavilitoribacter nigricans]PHN06822.1 tannase/feruloyl esterase family alpha/beta hydrolase [Flavilitoribacter nigricans DSM 23189 = NBRC 102662]